jgi:endonuclease G
MSMTERFVAVLEKAEARFRQQAAEREKKERLLEEGRMFEANPIALVEQRLARLNADPSLASEVIRSRAARAPAYAARPSDSVILERVLGVSDLISVRFLERGAWVARAVSRIHIHSPRGAVLGFGTGFMISPRLMLTNNHVLADKVEAAHSRAELSFEAGFDGSMKPSALVRFAPQVFFLTDPILDYTVVAVDPETALGDHGWLRLIEEQGKVVVGEWVNIIQHPNGEPKQLALRENQVVDELEQFLHYRTDTAPGSSGAPVFNDQWEVVALHHAGVPNRDAQGRILAVDGHTWADWMGEHRIAWTANEGTRISRVVAHLKAQVLDSNARLLRNEIFETEPPGPESLAVSPQGSMPIGCTGPFGNPSINADGSTSWTIPLTVTVNVGGLASIPPRPAAPEPLPAVAVAPDDRYLDEALTALSEARTRTYFDADADQAAAAAYYGSVDSSEHPDTLFWTLSELVRSTHSRTFSYKPAVHVYPWVDLHPDLKLRSIYSGMTVDPEEFIREDLRIAQERALRTRELMLREATLSVERLEEEIDLLEASLPYNCEHVVPQSWFNKKEPMRGDLHHLFACESGCNSFRGNIPYYDFPEFEEAVRDACGKRIGDDKFEPAHGKGVVARATLYFLLRYPGQIGDSGLELQRDRVRILLGWHDAFPPDDYERHRNMAIFEKQGNRNPLVDHPQWGSAVDFSIGFGGAR